MPRFERAILCLLAIQRREAVCVNWMMSKFGISIAQAKRDMTELERLLPVRREKREYDGRLHSILVLA